MPLAMRKKVFITAALTGSGGTQDRSDKVPRSPEQIANDAIEAAKAGAAAEAGAAIITAIDQKLAAYNMYTHAMRPRTNPI